MHRRESLHSIHKLTTGTLALLFVCAAGACAQQVQQPAQADTQKPVLPRVTTTVEVKDVVKDDYLQATATAASLDGATLKETPLAVTAVSRAVLNDQVARVLSDVVKNDASIAEDYAPVGYYGDFEIRGFPIDLATGLEINGMTIAGEQDVPLENKQSVEVVKGVAGLESGVASSGGLINFVTKRPVKGQRIAVEAATDHRGTTYGALDAGRVFGVRYEPGVRINLAGEDMHTYVQHADGWRGVGAADVLLKLDAQTNAYIDFDYQHKVQRSEAGYQLLGGTITPAPVFASTMLGYQSWSKPNTFDTFNADARLTHAFSSLWSARVEGSYSHSLIDDNVIWPYGAALDADGNSLCPDAPYYFFCPDGSYEIYDYRSPGELRTNAVGAALVQGRVKTGPVTHEIVGGGELFARRVELSSATVYLPLGVENVYQPNVVYAQDKEQAGPSVLSDFNHQGSGIVQDRMRIPGRVSLLAGGRYARVSSFAYDGKSRTLWLPQYGATWAATNTLTVYGNYGVLLSLGPQAPWWVDNSSAFLEPFYTRQAEAGVKYEKQILLTASVFRMRQPFFYPRVIDAADSFCPTNALYGTDVAPGDLCFESDGHETHTGLEVNAQGKAARWIQLTASAAALQAHSDDSQTTSYNGQQVINVPRARATVFADIALPGVRGLHLLPGWSLTSRKEATRDDIVSVGEYSLLNLGARWSPRGEDGHVTLRLYADNVLNKRYWKDTGANYGDTFIHQGAPATVRLAARYTF
ncbi:MAG TPA: TonB-dependent siderophore receptor [Terracidiphilus sp.]|nr:TonB-dependent siderophore receptor [Terracidiphilus sp.]